jgi:hypothetical protein
LLTPQINAAFAIAMHVPDRRRRAIDQHKENSGSLRIGRQTLFGNLMLTFSRGAVDDGNILLLRPAAHTTTEPASHANQMGIVERVVAAFEAAPPQAEPSGTAGEWKIRVQNDPVHAIVLTDQQVRVSKAQRVGSNQGKSPKRIRDSLSTAPRGPLFPGAVPEKA